MCLIVSEALKVREGFLYQFPAIDPTIRRLEISGRIPRIITLVLSGHHDCLLSSKNPTHRCLLVIASVGFPFSKLNLMVYSTSIQRCNNSITTRLLKSPFSSCVTFSWDWKCYFWSIYWQQRTYGMYWTHPLPMHPADTRARTKHPSNTRASSEHLLTPVHAALTWKRTRRLFHS